jgi:hypothetical protein
LSTLNGRHYRVAQAVAVVSTETDCTVDEALLVMQEEARANGQTLEEVASRVTQRLTRFRSRETASAPPTETTLPMPQHQFEARCVCGMRWRIYRDEDEEDPMAACIACGADTHDLADIAVARATGPTTPVSAQ